MKRYNIDVDKAAEMYGQGMTIRQIAESFSVNPQVISQRFYENGVATKGTLHKNEWFDRERAAYLYVEMGYTLEDIAEEMWVSTGKVRNELLMAGCNISAKRSRRTRKKLDEGEV